MKQEAGMVCAAGFEPATTRFQGEDSGRAELRTGMVAGDGFAPSSRGYEPRVELLYYPAACLVAVILAACATPPAALPFSFTGYCGMVPHGYEQGIFVVRVHCYEAKE